MGEEDPIKPQNQVASMRWVFNFFSDVSREPSSKIEFRRATARFCRENKRLQRARVILTGGPMFKPFVQQVGKGSPFVGRSLDIHSCSSVFGLGLR